MDFNEIKKKALELKKKAEEKTKDAIEYSSKKLAESSFTISKKEDLDKIIEKSKTTEFTNKETWETKTYKHKSIVVFWDEKSDFFKESLINFPVLVTKAFSQNIALRLAKSEIENVNLEDYKVSELPALVVFEEEKVYKTITWKENIKEVVKKLNLDINKTIEELN